MADPTVPKKWEHALTVGRPLNDIMKGIVHALRRFPKTNGFKLSERCHPALIRRALGPAWTADVVVDAMDPEDERFPSDTLKKSLCEGCLVHKEPQEGKEQTEGIEACPRFELMRKCLPTFDTATGQLYPHELYESHEHEGTHPNNRQNTVSQTPSRSTESALTSVALFPSLLLSPSPPGVAVERAFFSPLGCASPEQSCSDAAGTQDAVSSPRDVGFRRMTQPPRFLLGARLFEGTPKRSAPEASMEIKDVTLQDRSDDPANQKLEENTEGPLPEAARTATFAGLAAGKSKNETKKGKGKEKVDKAKNESGLPTPSPPHGDSLPVPEGLRSPSIALNAGDEELFKEYQEACAIIRRRAQSFLIPIKEGKVYWMDIPTAIVKELSAPGLGKICRRMDAFKCDHLTGGKISLEEIIWPSVKKSPEDGTSA